MYSQMCMNRARKGTWKCTIKCVCTFHSREPENAQSNLYVLGTQGNLKMYPFHRQLPFTYRLNLLRHEWQILDNFKKFLSIKVIKIVLDSMLYETLKCPQIAPFCISSKKNPRPFPLSRIMACILLSLSYAPVNWRWTNVIRNVKILLN
jgi:hypothetical protein